MAWIKRNLYFVIGSLIAVGLMGVGGYLLYTQIAAENEVTTGIEKAYSDLAELNKQNPHPGDDKVDNIQAAKDQEAVLRKYIEQTRPFFKRIPAIPETAKVSNSDFARELRNTVFQLQRTAEQQSVQLPNDYYFTFQAQKRLMIFDPNSLEKLAVQLGEIKVICDVLFAARINSLDSIQRETVSTNDNFPSDYLAQKTVSLPLADVAPYRVTFRCFSGELAQVLGGLASSPHALTVKTINVEPAAQSSEEGGIAGGTNSPITPGQPAPTNVRYNRTTGRMEPIPQNVAPAPTPGRAATFLNEKQLRVTLMITVTRLKPPTK